MIFTTILCERPFQRRQFLLSFADMNSVSQLRTLLVLGRVSNLPTVWSNCLAGWWLGGAGNFGKLPFLFLGMSLLYTGGMYLNDAFDEEFDRLRRPGGVGSGDAEVGGYFPAGMGKSPGGALGHQAIITEQSRGKIFAAGVSEQPMRRLRALLAVGFGQHDGIARRKCEARPGQRRLERGETRLVPAQAGIAAEPAEPAMTALVQMPDQ